MPGRSLNEPAPAQLKAAAEMALAVASLDLVRPRFIYRVSEAD